MATNREFLVDELGLTEEEAFETAQGDGYQAGWAAARQACAAEVEAAGCLCLALHSGECYENEFPGKGFKCEARIDFHLSAEDMVTEHDSRCPEALAARLRRLA